MPLFCFTYINGKSHALVCYFEPSPYSLNHSIERSVTSYACVLGQQRRPVRHSTASFALWQTAGRVSPAPLLCNYLIRYVVQWKLPTIPPNIPVSCWPAENSVFSVQSLWVPLTSAPLPPCFNESINASGTIPDPWQTSLSTYADWRVLYLRLSVLPH